jgi:glycosyltransferase involved in cell wall biosynthesis
MRLAWIGPLPSLEGGVAAMATQQLIGLADAGIEVEAFVSSHAAAVPDVLRSRPGLLVHPPATRWHYDRWYSRNDIAQHVSGAGARTAQLRRIGGEIVARHEQHPFDAVYQFSMPELFALHGRRRRLPPVAVHPEVHAAGELRWHDRERALSIGSASAGRHLAVHAMLAARSAVQHADLSRADLVIAPARRFAELLHEDCGVPRERLRVVPNPIDTDRFRPGAGPPRDRPRRVLFVSRIAARKGVDTIVALSHRIADLEGRVVIEVLGDRSLWSDYRHLLAGLHPKTALVLGHVPNDGLAARLQSATAVLQPSRYEPFALTVGEALACGTPAITSDEVGATEDVDPRVGIRVAADDVDAYERALRTLLATVEDPVAEDELRAVARAEALRLFATDVVGRRLAAELASFPWPR